MLLEYNLQFFAESDGAERTEPATQKKLEDARKKGQVAKSKEVANATGILSMFVVLKLFTSYMGTRFLDVFSVVFNRIPEIVTFSHGQMPEFDTDFIYKFMIIRIVIIMIPVLIAGFVMAFFSEAIQVGFKASLEPMKPKFDKLNPASGFKRIFSLNSFVELIKAILKIFLVFYISYLYLRKQWGLIYALYDMPLTEALSLLLKVITDLGIRIALVYMILALADYIYQKLKFNKDMRMTKQEVKDEYKQQEGDPEIKGKIRQRMQQASRRRMMSKLPEADVVITNPTHFAVAIKYDPEYADAPYVVAKGADYLAQKIKEVARENNVEIVENKPVARMLYANVDIGQAIPPELYPAIAEILAFVYKLKGKI